MPQSFSRANAAATHAGQGHGARVTRARARSMEDRCTGSAPSRLGHGTAARGMLGADGADFAARRERAARQSTSRLANDPTTHATSLGRFEPLLGALTLKCERQLCIHGTKPTTHAYTHVALFLQPNRITFVVQNRQHTHISTHIARCAHMEDTPPEPMPTQVGGASFASTYMPAVPLCTALT